MAFLSTFQLGDNSTKTYSLEYLVVRFRVRTAREFYDYLPHTYAHCRLLEISIVVTPGNDIQKLLSWYVNGETCSGRLATDIHEVKTDDLYPRRTIAFENAECYSIHEHYEIANHRRRIMTLRLAPQSITTEDLTFNS